jgi:predicted house-cleaning NTP pyrophosphatase (Maf/HAM1 superfamily)
MEKDKELNHQDNIGNSLEQDRAWAESLLNKQNLRQFNLSTTEAPLNYFESFPDQLMNRIESEKRQKLEKKNAKIFFLPSFMQPLNRLAIAAAFIIVVGGSFIFLNNSVSKKTQAGIVANDISIQELSNEEIESYVDANEWIAEIDVQAQMQKENSKLSSLDEKQIEEIQKIITQ